MSGDEVRKEGTRLGVWKCPHSLSLGEERRFVATAGELKED